MEELTRESQRGPVRINILRRLLSPELEVIKVSINNRDHKLKPYTHLPCGQ